LEERHARPREIKRSFEPAVDRSRSRVDPGRGGHRVHLGPLAEASGGAIRKSVHCPPLRPAAWRRRRRKGMSSDHPFGDPGARLERHPAAGLREHLETPRSRARRGHDLLQHPRHLSRHRGAGRRVWAVRRSYQHDAAPGSAGWVPARRRDRRRPRATHQGILQRFAYAASHLPSALAPRFGAPTRP